MLFRWLAVGLAAAALMALAGQAEFVQTIEGKAYDWRVREVLPEGGDTRAALVLVDEETLKFFAEGDQLRWPYPRDVYCPVLKYLKHAGAAAVAFDIQFSEPEEFDPIFAECVRDHGHVFFGYQCGAGGEDSEVPWTVPVASPAAGPDCRPLLPMADLTAAARGGGRIDMEPDPDGVLRWITPLWPAGPGRSAPTLGLAPLAAEAEVTAEAGELRVGDREVPLDDEGRLLVRWRTSDRPYPRFSFSQIYANGMLLDAGQPTPLDPATFEGKVVFVGTSAAGTYDLRVTPVREADFGIHLHAAVFDALDRGVPMQRAPWWADALAIVLAALAMAGCLTVPLRSVAWWPRLALSLVVVAAFLGANMWLFSAGVWLAFVQPVGAMFLAFSGGSVWNYLSEGRERRQIRHAFQHYLAPAVVDELLRDPSKLRLGGERREITCFFSDIAGFTSIAEQLEPATLVTLMNEVLSEMTAIVLDEGGTIDKYIGDAIVAIFGAPLPQDDHAARAVRAALRCQQRLEELRLRWHERGLPRLDVRIGLNSGVALVGNMGSAQRFDYTMLGDVVNLGARLEGTNKAYGTLILVGEQTAREGADAAVMRPIDQVRVKGKRQPVQVFEPLADGDEARDLVERSERVLDAYRGQRWAEARAELEAILAERPEDGPARVMLERVAIFEASPPGEGWDGIFEMTTK